MSRLVNIFIAVALLAGGGGTLAAAFCTHADCATSARPPVRDDTDSAPHDEHHTHSSSAVEDHHGDDTAAVEHTTGAHELQRDVFDPHDGSCGHCVGRSSSPPASEKGRRTDAPKREDRILPVALVRSVASPSVGFIREVTPHQGAPPGRASRYILNSVFRI